MKNLKTMNVNRIVLLLVFTSSIFSFSQKNKNIYFVLENDNPEYVINNIMFDEKIGFINLLNKVEYEHYQKKVGEAKKKDEYSFDPASGRDNLNLQVSKLTFEILSRERIKISKCEIDKLTFVNYNWILNNSWKKIAKKPYDFKDIYFLSHINGDQYDLYKVGVTIIDY